MGMLLRRHYETTAPVVKPQPEPTPEEVVENVEKKVETKGVKSNAVHAGKSGRKA